MVVLALNILNSFAFYYDYPIFNIFGMIPEPVH